MISQTLISCICSGTSLEEDGDLEDCETPAQNVGHRQDHDEGQLGDSIFVLVLGKGSKQQQKIYL